MERRQVVANICPRCRTSPLVFIGDARIEQAARIIHDLHVDDYEKCILAYADGTLAIVYCSCGYFETLFALTGNHGWYDRFKEAVL